jgi:hypothetical protein
MPTYPNYIEGWDVETTHPIEETEEGPICTTCLDAVQPVVNMAVDWGTPANGSQIQDSDGTIHLIVVRSNTP